MLQAFHAIRNAIASLLTEESGQDTFEYMLIIGGVTVAVILAIAVAAPSLLNSVKTGVCKAVNTINNMGVSC